METHYSLLTVVNVASNAIIGLAIILFIISVFGRHDHPVWEHKLKAYLCKIGLGICGCGALLNVLTFSTPPITEVVLNVGLAMNFTWLALWQHSETVKHKQQKAAPKPRPRKKKVVSKKVVKMTAL